jgi:hypothetical protein
MHRRTSLPVAIAFGAVVIIGSAVAWQDAAHGMARSTTASPEPPANAATPTSLDELLAICPADDSVPIPGAEGDFAPFGFGQAPVWLVGWGNRGPATPTTGATAHPGTEGRWTASNRGKKIAGYGWPMKALWAVSDEFDGVVTVHGASTDGHTQLWIQIGAETPVRRASFDLTASSLMEGRGWRQYPSYVIFPATGCYELVAEWDGGSWRAQVSFLAPDDSP